jgi:hypothetical protein
VERRAARLSVDLHRNSSRSRHASLHSRILALLSVAIYDATIAAWDSKYAYNRLRPTAFDPSLTAALPNPQSPSYPSEHAVIAGAASTSAGLSVPGQSQ